MKDWESRRLKDGDNFQDYKDQVAWLTDLMGKLQRLLQLGDQSENLAREVFSRDVFSNILNLFQEKEHLKLSKAARIHGKYTKERMEDILRRLEEKRKDANLSR